MFSVIALLAALYGASSSAAPAAAPAPAFRFTAPQRLAPGDPVREGASGGVDRAGRALVVWSQGSGGQRRVMAVSAAPGKPFGAPIVVGRGDVAGAWVGARGQAIIDSYGPDGSELYVGDTSGRFAPPRRLSSSRPPSVVVVAGDGAIGLITANRKGSTVQVMTAGGALGPARRYRPYLGEGTYLVAQNGGLGVNAGEVAAGDDGTIALVTHDGILERRPGERTFAHASTPLKGKIADPQVAVSPAGGVAVTAVSHAMCIAEYGCVGGVTVAWRPPGAARFLPGVEGPVARYFVDESNDRRPGAFAPQVAYGRSGSPVVTWNEDEVICTECDTEIPEGPRILWRPGGRRTVLSRKPAAAELVAAGDGTAVVLGRGRTPWRLLVVRRDATNAAGSAPPTLGDRLVVSAGSRRRILLVTDEDKGGLRATLGQPPR
jgi:hypothetical protein